MGGHGNDGQMHMCSLFALANDRGAFETVHLRHLHVHEYASESRNRRVIQDRERLTSIGRLYDRMPSLYYGIRTHALDTLRPLLHLDRQGEE
jgi:hypothetical protein